MGLRDNGLKAASGVARKVRGAASAAGGERKGQHSIEFKKSFGQHILKNPLVRQPAAVCGLARRPGSARPLAPRRLWTALWKKRASNRRT